MKKNTMTIFFFATALGCLQAAYQEPPAPPVIQYRPEPQKNITSDQQLRDQMSNIDGQIQQLANQREDLRLKVENAAAAADSLLQQYQEQVQLQQRYQQQMQSVSDNIAQLVKEKANIAVQLKK